MEKQTSEEEVKTKSSSNNAESFLNRAPSPQTDGDGSSKSFKDKDKKTIDKQNLQIAGASGEITAGHTNSDEGVGKHSLSGHSFDTMLRRPVDPEEELRWMSQEVRGYVEAFLDSLAADVPKAVMLSQVEKAKEDMLNLYSSVRDRMNEEVTKQELSNKLSDVPSEAKNLERRSISVVHRLPPGGGPSPQPQEITMTHVKVDEELMENVITLGEMPHDEEQNSDSSREVGAAIKEGHAGNSVVTEKQNKKSVVVMENDGSSDQWWMRSKVYPPPKRRSVSANRHYPQGCGRDLGSSVAGFNSKRVQQEKINGMNKATLGKNVETITVGGGVIERNSKMVDKAGIVGAGCIKIADKLAKNESFRDETPTKLIRDSNSRDANLCATVKGVEGAILEEKVDDKVSSYVEPDMFKGKTATVDNSPTSVQNKMAKSIKIKILCKGKIEVASKGVDPISESSNERAKEITGSSKPHAIQKSPLKVTARKRVGIKRPISNYSPKFSRIDRHASGDVDMEEYASCAILQSRKCTSRYPSNNGKKVAKKSIRQPQASSSGLNGYQGNNSYFGPKKDNKPTDPRTKVKRCLRLFQVIFQHLLKEVESGKAPADMVGRNRIDLRTSRILGNLNETLNRDKHIIGSVPGVEVGDEYRYRAELHVLGLHRPLQGGIDSTMWKDMRVATSIVASGGYSDDMEGENVLIYTGAGGQPTGKPGHTVPKDQKLERGNLALKNSMDMKLPVRVIHGQNTGDSSKVAMTFTYDGLYEVEEYWRDSETYMVKGKPMPAIVFRFRLKRLEGQPELNWSKLKKVHRSTLREGCCLKDMSLGKEKLPICVINTIDNEKPRQFRYITKTVYPSCYRKSRPKGCKCKGKCSDALGCSCAAKNGGQIPFNFNGTIIQRKRLIYECGPMCGCPPLCHNRVSQHGMKFPLEVFKTDRRGWGVRSLCSIPSGSFVCEYTGELLQDQEAEQRNNDEYLFDIGHNYDHTDLWEGLPSEIPGLGIRLLPSTDERTDLSDDDAQEGFTIDAWEMGNVGRFINHSCSPNLYAQNVLFDHEDRKMPHIMFFAAENIPPLKELTYDYNYPIGSVCDSDGNVKIKKCYCGSSECRGRLY